MLIGRSTYNTTLRSIIPLPDASLPTHSSAHPSNIDDYPKSTQVLALFPETTSFYPAKVLGIPSRNKGVYKVEFEGDDVPYREVAPSDVVLVCPMFFALAVWPISNGLRAWPGAYCTCGSPQDRGYVVLTAS
jgi:hypothetical protein